MSGSNRLAGRVALVTGAADGMGKAITSLFLREGAKVMAADISGDKLKAAFPGDSPDVGLLALDVTAQDAAETLVGSAVSAFGRLDILVNCAGIVQYEPVEAMSDQTWSRTMDININSVFRICRRAIPELRKAGGRGRIINIASIVSVRSGPGLGAYAASKFGVAGLSKTLAVELGPDGITVNHIQPGAILTGMTKPLLDEDPSLIKNFEAYSVFGRMGMPEDIANAALFLASDEASFITGHGLTVDGGFLAKL